MRLTLLTPISALLFGVVTSASATMITIDQAVDGKDNLYYTSWGHWFTEATDNALNNLNSNPASDVTFAGTSYDFAGINTIDIAATGTVVDAGSTATDADGHPNTDNYDFRDLPVYTLIGLWSTTASTITPIGDPHTAPFVIGTNATLNVPDLVSAPSAYLFLAENDGIFSDNSGSYNALITFNTQDVPEPSPAILLLGGLIGLVLLRRSSSSRS